MKAFLQMKLLCGLIAAGLGAFSPGAGAQQFTMRMSSPAIGDVNHVWMNAVKAGVEKRSGGRIKVEIYSASQLGPLPRVIEGVQLGTVQFTVPVPGFLIGVDPRFLVLDAPNLFDDMIHGHQVLADRELRKRLSTWGNAKGIEPLYVNLNGPSVVPSHKAIRTVADFRGQKLRVPGGTPLHVEPFKKLGVSPLSMPPSEVVGALQNRVIDGAVVAYSFIVNFKYYDIVKASTELPGAFPVGIGIVNSAFMKSLGPELEAIVRDEGLKAEQAFSTFGVQQIEDFKAEWKKHGGQLYELSPAEKKAYLELVASALPPLFADNPQLKEDYEVLVATARKYRK